MQGRSLQADVIAGADDARARQPDPVHLRLREGAQIGGIALCIAKIATGQHVGRMPQRCAVRLGAGQLSFQRGILAARREIPQNLVAARFALRQLRLDGRLLALQAGDPVLAVPGQQQQSRCQHAERLRRGGGRDAVRLLFKFWIEQIDLLAHAAFPSSRKAAPSTWK